MSLDGPIRSSITFPGLVEHSNSVQYFKRQYCIQEKPSLLDRILQSDRSRMKLLFFLFLFVMLIGGFVTKWCEYARYDKVVQEDIAFREEIRAALNGSDLFDQLDTSYTNWILENPWTFQKSIFFWLTLMTTIGYGDIFPITTKGRLWTVVFGIISIFTSALVVRILGNSHKDIFAHRSKTFKKYPKTCLTILFISSSAAFAGIFYYYEHRSGAGPMGQEGWTYAQSVYFVIMTFTTVGFGDFVPYEGITVILIIYGIVMLTMLVGEAQIMVKRLESDMRMIIDLADKGFNEATKARRSLMDTISEPIKLTEVELQKSIAREVSFI